MIELSLLRIHRSNNLRRAFRVLKHLADEKRAWKKRELISRKRYLASKRSKLFYFWRVWTQRSFPKVRKLEMAASRTSDSMLGGYSTKINALKAKILEVEKKIELVDKSTLFFMNGVSASYHQAIGVLNSELAVFQQQLTGELSRKGADR